jgi:4-hydroxy-3-methylbut-2-enyl diphosphate reductase
MLAYITQTTLSVDDTRVVIDALKARFPSIVGPDTRDICYATQNRQEAVRELAKVVDVILVIGAQNSSNSKRLSEIGQELGKPSYLLADASDLNPEWVSGTERVGITAGASAPEDLVQDLIDRLRELSTVDVAFLPGIEENIRFRLPPELIGQERSQEEFA